MACAGALAVLGELTDDRLAKDNALAAALRAGSYLACGGLFLLCVMNLAGSAFNPFIYFRF